MNFHSQKCIWSCRLKTGGHFVSASIYQRSLYLSSSPSCPCLTAAHTAQLPQWQIQGRSLETKAAAVHLRGTESTQSEVTAQCVSAVELCGINLKQIKSSFCDSFGSLPGLSPQSSSADRTSGGGSQWESKTETAQYNGACLPAAIVGATILIPRHNIDGLVQERSNTRGPSQ